MADNLEDCPYCKGAFNPACECIPMTFNPDAFKGSDELNSALLAATERYNALSIEERRAMWNAQRESYVRAEMSWPEPKFEMKMIDGVLTKVYASFEDYCNG